MINIGQYIETAMIRMWLDGGCQESPDEMYELMSIQSKNMAR